MALAAGPTQAADPLQGGRTSDAPPRSRRQVLAARLLAACLFLAFDAATILPAAAAGYVLKRSLHIDVFPGIDTLPDPMIENLLRQVARRLRAGLVPGG